MAEVDESELEAMPRKQLVNFILEQMNGVMKENLKSLKSDINSTREESARDRVMRQVTEMREKHKDFDDWKDEMQVLVKKNPMLDAREAYLLARAGDSKKAKDLDEKYSKDAAEDDDGNADRSKGDKGPEKKTGFGGMRPGSGARSEESHSMDKDEAFEKAWEESFGGDNSDLLTGNAA